MTALLFFVGQLLVADSIIVQWVATLTRTCRLSPAAHRLAGAAPGNLRRARRKTCLFYFFAIWPDAAEHLCPRAWPSRCSITRDLASNAIIIYSSKAVSRGDYLLGKFATAFGLLALTWLGPVCAAWFMGNLLAPDWRFFWHARAALANVLILRA